MKVKCIVYMTENHWDVPYRDSIEKYYAAGWVVKTHSIIKGNSTISHHFILEHPGNG